MVIKNGETLDLILLSKYLVNVSPFFYMLIIPKALKIEDIKIEKIQTGPT